MHKVAVLGSTGSIGTLTLEVLSHLGRDYRVVALSTHRNVKILRRQIEEYSPEVVCISDGSVARSHHIEGVKLLTGADGLIEIAKGEADIVVNALVGAEGIYPTLCALRGKKRVCIANKETLVSYGEIVMNTAREHGGEIIPIDSEHSAIHQCIRTGGEEVDEIILTASGGPFRVSGINEKITPEETLAHPVWKMGKKVTVDSATLMNKGLEVIEAVRLFRISSENISVVVHPQSMVHSLVRFRDGAILAQLSLPDMRLPIQYALTYPKRFPSLLKPLDLAKVHILEFEPPDREKFPCLSLAYRAISVGGTMPAVLSATDEVCVNSFLQRKITLLDIPRIIRKVMDRHRITENPVLGEIEEADEWARKETYELLEN
ncbi:1-deoxy-D-xylulose-5-phosphate reductoisomerase [candidate division WOR-3 bacterium JGI_Cruoil_03_44_89]|uniref:1-deoxy-D-xylulose 5-phosphate reductoisomerase n=1 Tax=candidate division WOR-3 bacterium JGI_Cruoil_03_44_89 TaxID=1973748 RepID=A0A235BUK3_UNCW3|nr:MAG: 1-deoxy-D-xylulose-5-phosphate reductoisomerase [candidate division WOR-3 bacterium JGI_Cruoil_03_44_89]